MKTIATRILWVLWMVILVAFFWYSTKFLSYAVTVWWGQAFLPLIFFGLIALVFWARHLVELFYIKYLNEDKHDSTNS